MITLQVLPDRYAAKAAALSSEMGASPSSTQENHIRRPTRGIVLKEDTFATLRVVAGSAAENIKIVDAGSRRKDKSSTADYMTIKDTGKRATDIYSNFFIQQVQEERVEKQQIIETFGEPYIFLFGERARVISFSGILANTFDFNWEAEWWHNYETYLRGTRCVEMDARVFLSYDTTLVGGYIISTAATKSAEQRNFVQFQFQLFVTSYANFSDVGSPEAAPPGANSALGIQGALQNIDVDNAALAQYRPTLLPDAGRVRLDTNGQRIGSGSLNTESILFLEDAVRSVSQVWNAGITAVNNLARGIQSLDAGAMVRVPIGYEGTMAFDEDADIQIREVKAGGKITYTTFADNHDEYVGSGDHYGSSAPTLMRDWSLANRVNDIQDAKALVGKAEAVWKEAGYTIPTSKMSMVSSFLLSKGLGLVGVGATAAWTAAGSATRAPITEAFGGVDKNTSTPE